jgi:hypothetical protein
MGGKNIEMKIIFGKNDRVIPGELPQRERWQKP